MADAMVTARIPRGKKESGNRVLEKLGTNASQAVNDLYDYLIEHESLPFGRKGLGERRYTEEEIAAAQAWARSFPDLEVSEEFKNMSKAELRAHRYEYLMKKHS